MPAGKRNADSKRLQQFSGPEQIRQRVIVTGRAVCSVSGSSPLNRSSRGGPDEHS